MAKSNENSADMEQTITLLTAFGLGSIMSVLIQAWLSRSWKQNERQFEEKKSAYIGLLEAYHRAAIEGTDEAAKNFAYWQMRCELVASSEVSSAISQIIETNDKPIERNIAHERLKSSMRQDLNIVK